ncbi:hypothetical protein [Nucisporomicrobium flavum]|uniref:hypothetical protein n=1 Tax=Nucisporomicrobium flavum TaxID=2785915 RepID=UPI0018F68C5D|nr:hypothetical protein [Nucisporomicrobium flavum]
MLPEHFADIKGHRCDARASPTESRSTSEDADADRLDGRYVTSFQRRFLDRVIADPERRDATSSGSFPEAIVSAVLLCQHDVRSSYVILPSGRAIPSRRSHA